MDWIEANALGTHRVSIFNCHDYRGVPVNYANDLKENHVLILHGGADISPSLYGEKLSPQGGGERTPSMRDKREWHLLEEAVKLGIPIVGICRGAQMLCAYAGGKLVQHIENHTNGSHKIIDLDSGQQLTSNSCHHQMMMPNEDKAIILAAATGTLGFDTEGEPFEVKAVPEVVHFPTIRAIGIQGHPEWMSHETDFVKYCSQQIQKLLLS